MVMLSIGVSRVDINGTLFDSSMIDCVEMIDMSEGNSKYMAISIEPYWSAGIGILSTSRDRKLQTFDPVDRTWHEERYIPPEAFFPLCLPDDYILISEGREMLDGKETIKSILKTSELNIAYWIAAEREALPVRLEIRDSAGTLISRTNFQGFSRNNRYYKLRVTGIDQWTALYPNYILRKTFSDTIYMDLKDEYFTREYVMKVVKE
ncbi:MAG: hypothetical protein ACTTJZ_05915 [Sphaerochaetaceae bacterium]